MSRKAWYWTILILGLLVIGGMMRLRFDVDVLNLLPSDLPVVHGLALYQKNFTDSRELILTVRSSDPAKTESSAKVLVDALRKQTNLIESVIWQPAWQERPAEAAELIGYLWLNQPPTEFQQLADRLSGTNIEATLADACEQLATSLSPMSLATRAYDPYNILALPESVANTASSSFSESQNPFSSPDKTFRLIFVKARPDISSYRKCNVWLNDVEGVVGSTQDDIAFTSGVTIGFTGSPAFLAEISSGMEHDMIMSIGLTSVIIAILFWIFHRRLVPMLWLLVLLGVILLCTLALGGLFFGTVNVVSLGFAGILLGLAVDYGVVHYQEALASPNAIIPEIRRAIRPSIFWAAVTTISAFLVLNFGGLPGLGQLGTLVALGVMLSALVMLFAFLPPLFRDRIKKRREQEAAGIPTASCLHDDKPDAITPFRKFTVYGGTALLGIIAVIVLASGIPRMDHTADALRPQHSPAYAALDDIKKAITQNRDPLWLITSSRDEMEIARRLESIRPVLEAAVSNQQIASFTLPTVLWPRPDFQSANRTNMSTAIAERETLRSAALKEGFTSNSLVLLDGILNTWRAALAQPAPFWPTNEMSRWIFEKFAAHSPSNYLTVGFIFASTNTPLVANSFTVLSQTLADQGFILSGWDLLGSAILKKVQQNMWKVLAADDHAGAFVALAGISPPKRNPAEPRRADRERCLPPDGDAACRLVLESAQPHGAAAHARFRRGLQHLHATRFATASWQSRRSASGGRTRPAVVRRHSGRGFRFAFLFHQRRHVEPRRSLRRRHRREHAHLGLPAAGLVAQICGQRICRRKTAGAVFALWPIFLARGSAHHPPASGQSMRRNFAHSRRHLLGAGIRIAAKSVIQNLLPPLNGDRAAAQRKGHEMIRQFALKMADLWRYESGLPIDDLFGEWTGWEHFAQAQSEKRGILLVTPHLGNWEFGGPLLTKRGVKLQVITLIEPGNGLTELRRASRARWDIETLVIGEDSFAFVEIIRRLESGATVALLVDRPPVASQTTVELFGHPFAASVAAAELARAAGCVVLPVYLPHTGHGYAAHILPAIPYDRRALRRPEERQKLTQQIINTFEPAIREHLDQWYHFVPLWDQRD